MATSNDGKLKCLKLIPSSVHFHHHPSRRVVIGTDFQFVSSLQRKKGKKVYPQYDWTLPNLVLCTDCETVLEKIYENFDESSERSDDDMSSSSSRQVEEASVASSALALVNSILEPPPQKPSVFSSISSTGLEEPRNLPKYIPSQLVDETGYNNTNSVMEVLINEDSEMSVNVNAPGEMGPPPPKPAVSTGRQPSQIATSVAKKDGGTAARPLSQFEKVHSEIWYLQRRYSRLDALKNQLRKEFRKLKDEPDNVVTPEEKKVIKILANSTLRLHNGTKEDLQDVVKFMEEWQKKRNSPLD